jgi:hypothetical protein
LTTLPRSSFNFVVFSFFWCSCVVVVWV